MSVKTFIGYDLGDGESVTDYVTMDSSNSAGEFDVTFTDMPMLGMKDGRSVPTVFGYTKDGEKIFFTGIINKPSKVKKVCVNFKRRPTDLLHNLTASRRTELLRIVNEALASRRWPNAPELNSSEMTEFRDSVVTFTNAIFENPPYLERVESTVKNSGSSAIVFCAGHPTKWDDPLDVPIYKLIISQSVLGKGSYAGVKAELKMSFESRAAYLFLKTPKAAREASGKSYLMRGQCALLIDVGSSTIDVTAVTADSNNYVYNHGNNYLGVRCIDFMIRDLYVKKLKRDSDSDAYDRYLDIVRNNPEYPNAIVMACRDAKEYLFSNRGAAGSDSVYIRALESEEVYMSEIEELINTQDVYSVLSENFNIPDSAIAYMRGKSWSRLFQEFLQEMKTELRKQNINIGRIIITGGASWMPVVGNVIKSVFSENANDIISDMDPSRSISRGLALVGPYEEKSEMFRKDVEALLNSRLPEIINRNIPKLADLITPVISSTVEGIVMSRIREWRAGSITTINGMKARIESDCSESSMKRRLENSSQYKQAMARWASDYVGCDIAGELEALCRKYRVTGFSLEQLNIFAEIKNLNFDVGVPDIPGLDTVFALVGFIVGVITAIMLPTLIAILINVIAGISVTVAALLVEILLAIPGPGTAILLVVGGLALIKAAISGAAAAKRQLMDYLAGCDLPLWVRKKMTDDKMRKEIANSDMSAKIRGGLLETSTRKKISDDITASLRGQVESKAKEIQYAIESR